MAHAKNHDYHILPPSIWPFTSAVAAFIMLFGAVMWMANDTPWMFLIGLVGSLYSAGAWWADTVKENKAGDHTAVVRIGLRYGVILFIMSEVMFFAAWFWAFFKTQMYPMFTYEGTSYVEPSIVPVDAFHLPLINTLILLCSGAAVTWAHHALVHENNRKDLIQGLTIGIILGVFFTILQVYEYYELIVHMGWSLSGDVFYNTFFMATGFHGFHVVIGTIFLTVCLIRATRGHFSPESHVGFEAAAWYWHFVDVVWLFLFAAVYIWGQA
ncbi:MAG: cytochrome c oxidase subunit 3 [Marivivens sp.]|jgi:cytochrome c oxidase subunit III|uniref:cytochrome c oxidase subunit 3 n=1 Tax=Marivivens sp. TaxID=1978374 RepID=UPI00201FA7AD|nr:cytochrome c oxidase subunit 3 [Marivivens sp.]MCL7406588.1 cytochrome c oxidase subunit 3 [Marivivens geojensis]NBQ50548.1 cytochrome c oxidase subunit 3 [Marivivens sp.]NBT50683.1 cytochrome c oxidase subunit 3 [Marivivens sp.]NBX08719.1 cytochrome c oxidase subunit 3 [Marivivens sp.]NCW67848.1 cytochrome c oxidase subunit 3 [Marivivens sp.]